jgi:hypothetical protein
MDAFVAEPNREIFALRAGIAFAELLVREFEEIALERHLPGDPECPCQKGARSAQRITEICARLIEELRRYERYKQICQSIEVDTDSVP